MRAALLRIAAALLLLPACAAYAQTTGAPAQTMTTRITIKADGSASGSVSVTASGAYAEELRARMRGASQASMDEVVTGVLASLGYQGSGKFDGEQAGPADDILRYTARIDIRQFASVPGKGSFLVRPLIFSAAPTMRFAAPGADSVEPDREFACSPGSSVETYVFLFPDKVTLTGAPSDRSLRTANLSYESSTRLNGNELSITRQVQDRHPGPLCPSAAMAAYRQLTRTVLDDLKGSVVFQ